MQQQQQQQGGYEQQSGGYEPPTYRAPAGGHVDYFARKGAENDNRPDHLPPSQGGKFGGFGNPACTQFVFDICCTDEWWRS